MKKVIILTLFVLLLFPVLAEDNSSHTVEMTTGGSGNFKIRGYFEGESNPTYMFMVWTGENNRIYHSGNIVLENLESFTNIDVFNWRLEWTSGTNLTLKFTFVPLQAYVNRMYYIPRHSFFMHSQGKADQEIKFNVKASGNFPYPVYTNDNDRIKSVNYNTSVSSTGSLSGSCTLNIYDYETEIGGDFVYENKIIVEFCVE